jgi:hypothetical protein
MPGKLQQYNLVQCFLPALILFFILLCPSLLLSEERGQTIRGRVQDQITFAPLEGATVVIEQLSGKGTITDSLGLFILSDIPPGRYTLHISFLGYHNHTITDILLHAGKEQVIDIMLTPAPSMLQQVTITAGKTTLHDPISYPGSRQITVEQSLRNAATFYDPARLILTTPGVVATNDQANHLVIRGNNPYGIQWRIEGVELVNPNHLTNAGTFSDKPSLTGGGVAIISTQLLGHSRFLGGALPAGYGNALSGVFDIGLRKGNNQKTEFTGQAGLLGIDLAVEGPFIKNYNGSYLVNYRYSTLGLFSAIGIPIGDEKINFQDLSFHLSLPTSEYGHFSLFGMGGKSTTLFNALSDTTQWFYSKDNSNIDFYSDMGAVGLTHSISAGSSSRIYTAVALSAVESGRQEFKVSPLDNTHVASDKLALLKISLSSIFFKKITPRHLIKTGIAITNDDFRLINRKPVHSISKEVLNDGSASFLLLQPFLYWKYLNGKNMNIDAGLHIFYSDLNHEASAEPRLSMKYTLSSKAYLAFSYSLLSQIQHPAIYFNSVPENESLKRTRAHYFVTGLSANLIQLITMKSELYYQYLFNVPVSADMHDSFSALNIYETTSVDTKLSNSGSGKNYGLDVSLETPSNRNYYMVLAGSLYNSLYTGSDGIERNSRFNGNYLVRITLGRDVEIHRNETTHTFAINIISTQAGGQRYTPIDQPQSILLGETIYQEDQAFTQQLDDFFRIDIRLMWKKNKNRFTSTLALDVQNLTNHKNPSWYYYDTRQQAVVIKNQLGFIPFISYRVEF